MSVGMPASGDGDLTEVRCR